MLQYNINWVKFGTGIIFSVILSLSVHIVMLQSMNVAFPDLAIITTPYKFISRGISVLSLLFFWELADKKIGYSFAKKWILLVILDAMLTETLFRGPFMNGYCTKSISFMLISNIPKLMTTAVTCGLIVFTAPRLNKFFLKCLAAAAIVAISMFVAGPLIETAWKPVMNTIAHLAPTGEWCKLPYGPEVLVPAYISFIEPVIACVIMAMLIWDQLSPTRWFRYLLFILIVLAIRNQLLLPIFYAVLGKGIFVMNLASEGQFALEAIVLAITAGFTFEWSLKR
ncbi:hypothetical protein [Mucilaginibacter lappiensis]|uniref:Uncharacterized protein n=1 Tax=Mucilaginibacter lappiensis TaxID=354630 RepID=A0A1N6QAX7_9SPHI|nr:hypothetical protein [Mucilaginibacter lappiensis]MBB6107283.1 hypothetical protein [Mucilaginibacter lappiensis]MBB6126442.1 hypothetical protein [Mucilaginibacter lappiensis]SIQ13711.1 hypothetical protein SAMN05421821_101793 [Mucilaginibacter lappiensis]